ncbi:MAG: hypothetical protein ACOC5T_05465 [Elusimicrobiota bacterium]
MKPRTMTIIRNDRFENEYKITLTTSGGVDSIRNLTTGKDIPSYTKMARRVKDWVSSPNDKFRLKKETK